MRKTLLLLLCVCFTLAVTGCGTIKGIGEDVTALGGWLTKGSENVQEGSLD